jgi:hypothetical protein
MLLYKDSTRLFDVTAITESKEANLPKNYQATFEARCYKIEGNFYFFKNGKWKKRPKEKTTKDKPDFMYVFISRRNPHLDLAQIFRTKGHGRRLYPTRRRLYPIDKLSLEIKLKE